VNIPAGLRPHFQAISILGLMALVGDAWLSIKFGASNSVEMAIIYGVISVASGLILVAALFFNRIGWKWIGRGLAVLWVPVFGFNVLSNMGVATANRMGEVQSAQVQQTNYAEQQASVAEAKRSLELFQGQLAGLLVANAWAGEVKADGLRAQIDDLRKAEAAEARLGGCRQKCRSIQNQIAEVQGKLAVAERRSGLEEQIAATKRVIAKNRETLANTDKGISATANQSTVHAKLISWNLASDPNADMVTVANEGMGMLSAIVLALIAAALTVVGVWPHIAGIDVRQIMQDARSPAAPVGEPGNHTSAPPSEMSARAYPSMNLSRVTVGEINREKLRQLLDNGGLKVA
jgi:hypothetical protein